MDHDDAVSDRPAKVRKTNRSNARVRTTRGREWEDADALATATADDEGVTAESNGSLEGRSCENCRRSKLKCSRSHPCDKCVTKGIQCIYELSDKKRGPRPGYIDELYRRIDALEHMMLGQALLNNREPALKTPSSLDDAVRDERKRLEELGRNHQIQHGHQQHPQTPGSSNLSRYHCDALDRQLRAETTSPDAAQDSHNDLFSRELLLQLSDIYRHQIQPWLPILRQPDLNAAIAEHDPSSSSSLTPILEAMTAAAAPYATGLSVDVEKHFSLLQQLGSQELFRSANLDQIRVTLVLQFLLFGNGQILDHWGLVAYPVQLALRAGLHLEDHHLTTVHRDFRRLVKMDYGGTSWTGRESVRRLFWVLFLQDQFAAIFSGTSVCFDVATIRRLLPCDGQRWYDGNPVQTREFVPASVAMQLQLHGDSGLGGLAYLIEATEVLTMVTAFARRATATKASKPDIRDFLREFLSLDLTLTNWKASLPPRYHQASYDETGYMDHNVTLAHLTHNTSGILLHQVLYTVWGARDAEVGVNSSLLSRLVLVKQAAKESTKICSRFLLHRPYLASPQFVFCQFIAARALLAYSSWMMEPVDDDFGILYTSLGESAKRWIGQENNQRRESLAAMLRERLSTDLHQPGSIDLATPCTALLKSNTQSSDAFQPSIADGILPVGFSFDPNQPTIPAEAEASGPSLGAAAGLEAAALFGGDATGFDRAMSLLVPSESQPFDSRMFSWQDSPELLQANSEAGAFS